MYTCDVTDKLFCFVIRFLRLGVSCFKYRGSIWWCKISFRIWNVRNVRFSSWRFEPVFRLNLWYVFEMLFQLNHGHSYYCDFEFRKTFQKNFEWVTFSNIPFTKILQQKSILYMICVIFLKLLIYSWMGNHWELYQEWIFGYLTEKLRISAWLLFPIFSTRVPTYNFKRKVHL